MSEGKRGIPTWVWILLAAPLALVGCGMLVRMWRAATGVAVNDAKTIGASPAPGISAPLLSGGPADLSTVMGRARKLANAWQPEAALLGIEATLVDGKIQAQDGAAAKVTFGPSAFDATRARSGLFVVTYDKTGINGTPVAGTAGKILPEPMCAPERVLSRVAHVGEGPLTLRYGFDAAGRPLWMASFPSRPEQPSLFDAQDCSVHGLLVGPRNKR